MIDTRARSFDFDSMSITFSVKHDALYDHERLDGFRRFGSLLVYGVCLMFILNVTS